MTLEDLGEGPHGAPQKEPEEDTIPIKIYRMAKIKLEKIFVSDVDSSLVYGIIRVNDHYETIELGSHYAKQWLKASYFAIHGKIHSDDNFTNVLSMIAAQAQQEVFHRTKISNRIAMTKDAIYYDLCSPEWEAVKITKEGYKITSLDDTAPVFARYSQQSQQVPPQKQKPNPLEQLVTLLRIQQQDKQVFLVHLISMFLETYPIPIMVIHGEHGSIKSTIAKTVTRIVDPSSLNISSIPKQSSDLVLQLYNRYLCNFDNVSSISQETSDILCRAVTGEGITKRKLYTDSDEVIWKYQRKIVLNGIVPGIEYPDLKERCIFYETIPVKENERLSEEEFEARLKALLPSILDQIFSNLSDVLVMYRRVKKEVNAKFRMADFTIFGECISRMLGYTPMSFVESYREKLDLDSIKLVDSYPIVGLVVDFMKDREHFEDTMQNFFKEIQEKARTANIDTSSKYVKFPKATNQLSNQIKQLKSTLRKYELEVTINNYNSRDGKYPRGQSVIKIKKNKPRQTKLD